LSVTSQGSGNFVPYNRSFSYDAVGNRIGDSQNGTGTFVSNFLTRNSYASYNPDPDGTGAVCQIKNSSTQAVRQFTYRADGSLVSFTDGTTRVDYAYDPYGRRIAKVVHQGGNTYTQSYTYLTGEDDVMLAKAGDGSITIYLHGQGPNVQLAEVKNGVGKGYTTDHVGGVLNGDVAGAANAFGIFGEVVTPPNLSVSSNPVMYGFAGMTFDPESGNYQSQGLRQYDPQVGRWNQQEPTGLDGPNYYHYVFSNPMTHIDPTGQNTRIVTQVGHEVLEVDDPDHPGQVISIGLGPDWKKTTLGDVIKGPVPGYVDISSGRAGGGFVIPGTEVTQSRQEDAWILQQAKMLQQAFSNGDLQFDVLGWNTNGNATNCAGFASSLQHSGGM
jgi:RHS repeat-associated protein